jgi:hypothetical protein
MANKRSFVKKMFITNCHLIRWLIKKEIFLRNFKKLVHFAVKGENRFLFQFIHVLRDRERSIYKRISQKVDFFQDAPESFSLQI